MNTLPKVNVTIPMPAVKPPKLGLIQECKINERWDEHLELQKRRRNLLDEVVEIEKEMQKKLFEIQNIKKGIEL